MKWIKSENIWKESKNRWKDQIKAKLNSIRDSIKVNGLYMRYGLDGHTVQVFLFGSNNFFSGGFADDSGQPLSGQRISGGVEPIIQCLTRMSHWQHFFDIIVSIDIWLQLIYEIIGKFIENLNQNQLSIERWLDKQIGVHSETRFRYNITKIYNFMIFSQIDSINSINK